MTCATSQKGELIILNTKEIRYFYKNRHNTFWPFDKNPETELLEYDIASQNEIDNALVLRDISIKLYQEWLYQKWILSEMQNNDPFRTDNEKFYKELQKIKRTFKQKNMIKFVKDVNLGLIINERE